MSQRNVAVEEEEIELHDVENGKKHSKIVPLGTLLEFWIVCAISIPLFWLIVPISFSIVKRRSYQWGSVLGLGISLSLCGLVLTLLMAVGTISSPHAVVTSIPAVVALLFGPASLWYGINGWSALSLHAGTIIDIIIVVVVCTMLVAACIIALGEMILSGLLQAM